MNFELSPQLQALRDGVRHFIGAEVIPLKPQENERDDLPWCST
jgi:hypothetical protein